MMTAQPSPLPQMNPFNKTQSYQFLMPNAAFQDSNPSSMAFAGPDLDMQAQDVDMPNFSAGDLDAGYMELQSASVNSNLGQFPQQTVGYENTTHHEQLQTTFQPGSSSNFLLNYAPETFNQALQGATPLTSGPTMGSLQWDPSTNSLPTMNNVELTSGHSTASLGISMLTLKKQPAKARAWRRCRPQTSRLPNRKTPPVGRSALGKTTARAMTAQSTLSYDGTSPHTPIEGNRTKNDNADPQKAIDMLKKSMAAQPYSMISQRKVNDVIAQLEQVVLDEKKYGSSSSENEDVTHSSTVSSTQDSVSNAENIDSDCPTDATSVSSTPRPTMKDVQASTPIEAQPVHKKCGQCGIKPILFCTKQDCNYSTHTFGDFKRHEEGDKHYPQERFMCVECPIAQAPLAANGNPVCQFCDTVFFSLALLRAHYLHCPTAKDKGKTFGRKDHFTQHLREEHPITNPSQHIAALRYPINSNWPRQCSRCGEIFQTWDERMKHIAKHAEKDFRPGDSSYEPKDDDSDNEDDFHGGSGRPQRKAGGRQAPAAYPTQQNKTSGSSTHAASYQEQYRGRSHVSSSEASNQIKLEMSSESSKPTLALERYLNDAEEPVPIRLRFRLSLPRNTKPLGQPNEGNEEDSLAFHARGAVSALRSQDGSNRRNNKSATEAELARRLCSEPGCGKEFKRHCALIKHEEPDSRLWKRPVNSCKYHKYGWPTEKEMDRHHDDKHSAIPPLFKCQFEPCLYASKRESNCKQHMERAHCRNGIWSKNDSRKRPRPVQSSDMAILFPKVYTHPDAGVDIVIVHGLSGQAQQIRAMKNSSFCPAQLLPELSKSSQIRILTYGYNADLYTFRNTSKILSSEMIRQHAQNLAEKLSLEKRSEKPTESPIKWVALVLGRIVVKRALELSADHQSRRGLKHQDNQAQQARRGYRTSDQHGHPSEPPQLDLKMSAFSHLRSMTHAMTTSGSSRRSRLEDWQNDRQAGFVERIAANKCSLPNQAPNAQDMPSRTTSLAVSLSHKVQSSTATNAVPDLSSASSTASTSSSSVNNDLASLLGGAHLLEEGDEGVLELPLTQRPRYSLPCVFQFLECTESFNLFDEWRVHVLSHFRTHAPPTEAQSPLCSRSFKHAAYDGAWNLMLSHLARDHFQHGHTLATSRPDFALFKFLYNKRILNEPQFKALYMTPANGEYESQPGPSSGIGRSNEPFVSTSNERRQRRVQDRGRPVDARASRGSTRPLRWLHMTVGESIDVYAELSKTVFGDPRSTRNFRMGSFKGGDLEKAVIDIVNRQEHGDGSEDTRQNPRQALMCAMAIAGFCRDRQFGTRIAGSISHQRAIWQLALATTAAGTLFKAGRQKDTALQNLQMFHKLCGRSGLRNVIISIKMLDTVDQDMSLSRGENTMRPVISETFLDAGMEVFGLGKTPPKVTKLIHEALERGSGKIMGEVRFNKEGWGRWDAGGRGKVPKEPNDTHIPHYDENDLPRSERLSNNPNIPSTISRERPPQFKEQLCGCHCHTGNGCYCTEAIADPNNSNSNGHRGVEAPNSDTNTINIALADLDIIDGNYDGDSDIDLDSESSSSSFVPYQYYTLGSPEFEGTVEALRDHYDFLRHVDDMFHLNSLVDDNPDDLDSAFNGPMHLIRSPRRLVSPAASMEVNFPSEEHSLRSSMIVPAMQRSGAPSYYTRCADSNSMSPLSLNQLRRGF